jgi:hypothetical protein
LDLEKIHGCELHAVRSHKKGHDLLLMEAAKGGVPSALSARAAQLRDIVNTRLLEYCTQTSITALITHVEPRQYSSEQMLSFWKSC